MPAKGMVAAVFKIQADGYDSLKKEAERRGLSMNKFLLYLVELGIESDMEKHSNGVNDS